MIKCVQITCRPDMRTSVADAELKSLKEKDVREFLGAPEEFPMDTFTEVPLTGLNGRVAVTIELALTDPWSYMTHTFIPVN